jgi:hypothetical protein
MKIVPAARRISDHQCKTTFATVSAESDITEKQRPLVYELRRTNCDARPANAKE